MYIKKMKINNYKKLVDFEFEFGQMNVIIGKNNAGKSTFLQVLKSFLERDAKIFKNYEGLEEVVIKIETNEGIFSLGGTAPKPTWVAESQFEESDFEFGFMNAHTTTEELKKILESGLSGYITGALPDLQNNINMQLEGYSMTTDLDQNKIISEEDTDYSFKIDFNLSKSFKFNFNDNVHSIQNKGLGQQKEFVLNQFAGESPMEVDILLIDEIENSLSMESVKEIINSLYKEEERDNNDTYPGIEQLQVFYSTHNSYAITAESSPNIIPLGSVPDAILSNLSNSIFVEGPSDAIVFKKHYPSTLFIPGGGSHISEIVKSVFDQGHAPRVIVDGDNAGLIYKRKISSFLPAGDVMSLSHGTIEDYYNEADVINIINRNMSLSLVPPLQNNILKSIGSMRPAHNPQSWNQKIQTSKKEIQKQSINESKLRSDLDSFIII